MHLKAPNLKDIPTHTGKQKRYPETRRKEKQKPDIKSHLWYNSIKMKYLSKDSRSMVAGEGWE